VLYYITCPPDTSSSKTASQRTKLEPRRTAIHAVRPSHCTMHSGKRQNYTTKDQLPANLPDINSLNYHVCVAMLEAYHKRHSKRRRRTQGNFELAVTYRLLAFCCYRVNDVTYETTNETAIELTI